MIGSIAMSGSTRSDLLFLTEHRGVSSHDAPRARFEPTNQDEPTRAAMSEGAPSADLPVPLDGRGANEDRRAVHLSTVWATVSTVWASAWTTASAANLPTVWASADEVAAVGLAWAKVLPTVTLVPAFGLKALPAPARAIFGVAMAAAIAPAVTGTSAGGPWIARALEQVVAGLPVAIAAAVPLWSATMTGGLVDTLRGAETSTFAVVEGRTGSFGALFGLFAGLVFLSTGGAARTAGALATPELPAHPLLAAMHDLTAGIGVAVAIAGPVLATSIVLEITLALVARAATPAHVQALFAPIRSLGLLAIVAVALERMLTLVARFVHAPLG